MYLLIACALRNNAFSNSNYVLSSAKLANNVSEMTWKWMCFNHLKMKHRLFYLKTQFIPHSKHFSSVIKTNQLCCMGQKLLFVLR